MSENKNLDRILAITMKLDWDDPEQIYDKWIRTDRKSVESFLSEIYEDCDVKKITSLFVNYEYFENQLLNFLPADSQAYDKTSWILKQYFEKLIGGIPDEISNNFEGTRRYYHPEFGTTDDWLYFVETMDDMYHNGPTEKNMRGIKRMQALYDEQYEV
jgi:hypothetical protein